MDAGVTKRMFPEIEVGLMKLMFLAQLYADDIQAYLHCSASDAIATTQVMTFIMGAFGAWMSSNRLRLNSAKTQFIWLGTRQQLAHLDMAALSAAFPLLTFSS